MTNGSYTIHQNLLKRTIIETQKLFPEILFIPLTTGNYKTEWGRIAIGTPGNPDCLFVFPYKGELLAGFFEVKTGKATLSKEQIAFKKRIVEMNGLYIIVRSKEDLINKLKERYANVQLHQ